MGLKRLKVDLDELAQAMDTFSREDSDFYLDMQTGKVLLIQQEFLDDEFDERAEERGTLPEWQIEARAQGKLINEDEAGERFVRIPETDRHKAYRIMEDFIAEVPDRQLRKTLQTAIAGKGAFRRFKDALFEHPLARQKWFDYEEERKREWARAWLESLDVESMWEPRRRPQTPAEWQLEIEGLHHVEISVPSGQEEGAREFYCKILGLTEIPKPNGIAGGFWLRAGEIELHVAVAQRFNRETAGARVGYEVTDLVKWEEHLRKHGVEVLKSIQLSEVRILELHDPFGNRVALVQRET